ncbi:MAG: antiviral reverse transcriptase Drt4, partial [Euryarchaeota archaeon]|nr:antiviral reverse transcriptase Drt4 [Euryarchaeota archaeon]
MSLDKKFLLKALLQYNYFPSQKKNKEELPPTLNSKSLTPKISEKLVKLSYRKGGYDQVEYKLTRYNNVPRPLSIPHPMTYAKLCQSLHDNWEKLEYITQTENSLIIPKEHNDGRIIVMDYENTKETIERHIKLSFNKKFYVNTDISNFFPSIYSHSIPWALVGFDTAKKERGTEKWFNQIDFYQRLTKRNETNGVPIGPASSNIICESILARIDKTLNDEDFEFIRFIDDYTAYCKTYEKAEEFIRRLSEELSKYKLLLNIKKTFIAQLPSPSSPEWIVDLTTRIPDKENISPTNIIRFLDYAVTKQAISPDGSVLKYAAKSIIKYD